MSHVPTTQITPANQTRNNRPYPPSASLHHPLSISPANSGKCCSSYAPEHLSAGTRPIQKQLQCHALGNGSLSETFHLSHNSWPMVNNSRTLPCSQSCCRSHTFQQATPDPENCIALAKARSDRTSAWDLSMATNYENFFAHQYQMNFPHPPPPQLNPQWKALRSGIDYYDKENTAEYDMGHSMWWPSHEKPQISPTFRHDSCFNPTSVRGDTFHDVAKVQIDDYLNPYHITLPQLYDNAQNRSLTSTTSYDTFPAEDTSSSYDTAHSGVGLGLFDDVTADVNNPIELTSTASTDLPLITDCINHKHGASPPSSLSGGVQNEYEPHLKQFRSITGPNTAPWNSFLNVGAYKVSLNVDDPIPADMNHTQNQELLAGIYDPPLPMLEENVTFDQDLQQAYVNDVILDNEVLTSKLREAKNREMLNDKANRTRSSQRDVSVDRKLIEWKQQGLSYKEIKERGGFTEAESTLRGRYRTLTKNRQERLRKPVWPESAVNALLDAVEHFLGSSCRQGSRGRKHTLNKVPWKKVAEWMAAERGCYRYGNATVKKKYQELQQTK